jgi:hypothetical protein
MLFSMVSPKTQTALAAQPLTFFQWSFGQLSFDTGCGRCWRFGTFGWPRQEAANDGTGHAEDPSSDPAPGLHLLHPWLRG